MMETAMKMNGNHHKEEEEEELNNYAMEEDDEKPKTSNNNTSTNVPNIPLFCTIGIIADIQYAPIPDGYNYTGTNARYYRHSLIATKNAFQTFTNYIPVNNYGNNNGTGNDNDNGNGNGNDNDNGNNNNNNNNNGTGNDNNDGNKNGNNDTIPTRTRTGVDIVINLGDIVDGKCQSTNSAGGILIKEKAIEQLVVDNDPNNQTTKEDKGITKQMDEYLLNKSPGMLSLKQVQHAMLSYTSITPGRKILHTYGNHCLYNFNRTQLRQQLGIPFFIEEESESKSSFSSSSSNSSTTTRIKTTKAKAEATTTSTTTTTTNIVEEDDDDDSDDDDDGDLVGYYSYVYPPSDSTTDSDEGHNKNNGFSIKFIILDGYDISLMKRSNTKSKKYKLAEDILKKENPVNYKANNTNSPEGLEGTQKRFVGFNGAIGDQQLIWLKNELQQSRNCSSRCNNQKVIVLCHQSIHPDSSNPVCVLWNYDKVLDMLRSYSDIVIGAFSGHAHKGGYVRDPISGIHFRIIEAVLESKPTISTYGVLEIYYNNQNNGNKNDNKNDNDNTQNENCIVLKGYGDCQSAIYDFNHCDNNSNNEWKNGNTTNFETATATATVPCSLVDY